MNIKNFGAFTFEVASDVVQPIQFSSFNTSSQLDEQRQARKHVHKIRPCFVADPKLKYQLTYYNNKEEINGINNLNSVPKSQHSIF